MEKPNTVELIGLNRETGSKAAGKTRADERVPAVLYGPTVTENLHFSLKLLDVERLLKVKRLQFVNIAMEDGSSHTCLLKKAEFHPVTDRPVHLDFQVTDDTTPVTVVLPIRLTGSAKGVLEGGRLYQSVRRIKVKAVPADLPAELTIDVSKLGIGQALRVKNLKLANLTPVIEPERTIVMVRAPKGGKVTALADDEAADEPAAEEASEA
jgi:large subunit ribosomal protein L25